MAIPSQAEMYKVVLQIMNDKGQLSREQAKAEVRKRLNLSDSDAEEKTSSGAYAYKCRADWAMSWLSDAAYIARIGRSLYQITDAGRIVCAKNLSASELGARLRQDRLEHTEKWRT